MGKKETKKDKKLRNKPHHIEEKNNRVIRFIQHLFGYINGRALQHMSLRKQLLIPIVSVMVIVSIIGASFSYIYGARMIREQLTNATRQQLNATDQTFNTYFDDAQSVVRQFTINPMLNNVDKNFNQIQKDFENVLSSNTKYQALTYASAKKDIVRSPLYFFSSSYDPTAERWYQEGVAGKGKSIWTDPYIDQVTKQNVVSVEQAVVDGDRVNGVIKMDLFIQSLVREVSASKLGDNGHAALLDSKGTYIASADQDEVGKSAAKQDFYKKMHQMGKSGSFYATIDGVKRLVVFKTNEISGWTLLGIIDNGEIANKANLIALPSVLTILIIIAVAILYIIYVFGIMLKRLKKIQRAAGKIEKGDLTVVIPIEGKDEFAQLTHSINALAHANRQALKKMADVSQQIAGASQTLVASSEENVASANEITATVTEIAAGASNQSASIDESQASLQELLQQVNQIDQQSKEALTGANQMKDYASGGRAKMNHLSSQSRSSADTTRKIITTVQKLDEHAKNVHQIVDVLDGIARRTNLLSLNASIEAAHAGEHGKGFAVVAGEIRKLAQQTNVSLKEVTASVQSMNEEIKQAVAYCDETATVLQGQTDAVSESDHAFKEIEKTIQQNVKGLETIADAIIMTHQQIEQVTQGAQTIAATSEETAASTEEMSASVQEQTASMEELNRLAGELEQQAQTMQEEIKRFKI